MARTMWLSMRRVIIAVVVLAACLSLAGCSHSNKAAFAKPLPSPLPHPIKASWMKPPQQLVRKLPRQGEFFKGASATCYEGSSTC